jgi:hypothetical protein
MATVDANIQKAAKTYRFIELLLFQGIKCCFRTAELGAMGVPHWNAIG